MLGFSSIIAERNIAFREVFIPQVFCCFLAGRVESQDFFLGVWVGAGGIDYPARCCTGTCGMLCKILIILFACHSRCWGRFIWFTSSRRLAVSLLQQFCLSRAHMADIISRKLPRLPPIHTYGVKHWGAAGCHRLHSECNLKKHAGTTSWERFNFLQMTSVAWEWQPGDNQSHLFWFVKAGAVKKL